MKIDRARILETEFAIVCMCVRYDYSTTHLASKLVGVEERSRVARERWSRAEDGRERA